MCSSTYRDFSTHSRPIGNADYKKFLSYGTLRSATPLRAISSGIVEASTLCDATSRESWQEESDASREDCSHWDSVCGVGRVQHRSPVLMMTLLKVKN
jgi:hypothetical protein